MGGLNISGTRLLPVALLAKTSDLELAKQHFKKGRDLHDQGRFDEALDEFLLAYRLSKKPELQYNLALCYEKILRFENALTAYRLYLQGKPDAPDRKYVKERIAFLRIELRKQKSRWSAGVPEKSEPFNYRPLMWTSLALSAAGLTAGGYYYRRAVNKTSEYNDLVSNLKEDGRIVSTPDGGITFRDSETEATYGPVIDNKREDINRFDKFAKIGFIGGALFVAGGGIFYLLDRRQQRLHLDVETQAGGGMFSLGGSF